MTTFKTAKVVAEDRQGLYEHIMTLISFWGFSGDFHASRNRT